MDRMSTGCAIFVCTLLASVTAHAQDSLTRWVPIIAEASDRFGIPAPWIRAVLAAESGGRTHLDGRPITSPMGAMGLMQLMPQTYAEMRRAHDLGADPHAPRDNILAGAAYLRAMHDRFGWPGLFAAYNAGPGRYEMHLRDGATLPAETETYLTMLQSSTNATPPVEPGSDSRPSSLTQGAADFVSGRLIFFVRDGVRSAQNARPTVPPNRRAAAIFVPLSGQRSQSPSH